MKKMSEDTEVFPGDEVAVEEEYLASDGTFAADGKVYASQIGTLVLDDNDCVAKVISPNPPNILHIGDVVYAVVADIRKTMVTADVAAKQGTDREVGGETYATIHVSKISSGYTDNIRNELRKGDLIRARVIDTEPSLQLTTKEDHFGVIRAKCGMCKTELVRRGDDLFCPECRHTQSRKLADDYGNVEL